MRRAGAVVAVLVIAVAAFGCLSPSAPDVVRVTGTVHHYAFEGGFWAIRGDDSTTYDPVNGLPSGFEQEGLRVRLVGTMPPDLGSYHLVGPVVEIISLQRL